MAAAATDDEQQLAALLNTVLFPVCASWLVSEAEHAAAAAALEERHTVADAAYRLQLVAGVLVAVLQHLLRLPAGLAAEPVSRKAPRLDNFFPQMERFLQQHLSAHPSLLSTSFVAVLKHVAYLVNWQPVLLTCLLFNEPPPGSSGSAGAPLFTRCTARTPDYPSLLKLLPARLKLVHHGLSNVCALRPILNELASALVAAT